MKTLLILLLVGFSLRVEAQLPRFITDSLDGYVNRAMRDWQIPGVALAVVKEGRVVLTKTYGVRETGKPDRVDENTLFMIGSNSKAFTATALAMLEQENKLSIDDKVTKWLPEFKLYDPCVTQLVTIRDLLCHRVGLQTFQGDFMYWTSNLSRREVMQKFGLLKPPLEFRGRFGYCNAAFLTAGEVIPAVTGKTWEVTVQEKILTPLGMSRSLPLSAQLVGATNAAASHTVVEGKLLKIPYPQLDNLAPAGSISASVIDLTKWISMQLDTGRLNGQQVIPKAAVMRTWVGQTVANSYKSSLTPSNLSLYGLGWFRQDYAGHTLIEHTGGVDGFVTATCFSPDARLGVIVLTNTDANGFYQALKYQLLDAFLGQPFKNYYALLWKNHQRQESAERDRLAKERAQVVKNLPPALPLAAYAGRYSNPVYGDVEVTLEGGTLVVHFAHHPNLTGTLAPKGGNEFLARYSNPTFGTHPVPFTVEAGRAKSLQIKVNDFVEYGAYEFKRE